jgi:hypothetical protein
MEDIMADHTENTKQISSLKTFIEKLAFQVRGINGTAGHEQRIKKVEDGWDNRANTCAGLNSLREYLERKEKEEHARRTWRIGDIANIIQLLMLALTLYIILFLK